MGHYDSLNLYFPRPRLLDALHAAFAGDARPHVRSLRAEPRDRGETAVPLAWTRTVSGPRVVRDAAGAEWKVGPLQELNFQLKPLLDWDAVLSEIAGERYWMTVGSSDGTSAEMEQAMVESVGERHATLPLEGYVSVGGQYGALGLVPPWRRLNHAVRASAALRAWTRRVLEGASGVVLTYESEGADRVDVLGPDGDTVASWRGAERDGFGGPDGLDRFVAAARAAVSHAG